MVSVTFVSVRPHENDKPVFSKTLLLGQFSKTYEFGARKRRLCGQALFSKISGYVWPQLSRVEFQLHEFITCCLLTGATV